MDTVGPLLLRCRGPPRRRRRCRICVNVCETLSRRSSPPVRTRVGSGLVRRDGCARFRGRRSRPEYRITRDGVEVFATATEEDVFRWLCQDIDNAVAQRSRQMLFVHAGVVGWRGLAIVIPGRSHTGKSTLVAELVRRGAVYYSDEFAVLDDTGRVHPYRRTLVLRERETAAARSPSGAGGCADGAPADRPNRGWGLPARGRLAADHCPRGPSGLAAHRRYGPGARRIRKDAANRCSRRAHRRHAPGTAVRGDGSRRSSSSTSWTMLW